MNCRVSRLVPGVSPQACGAPCQLLVRVVMVTSVEYASMEAAEDEVDTVEDYGTM